MLHLLAGRKIIPARRRRWSVSNTFPSAEGGQRGI